ncbi:transcriptional regulator, partial [Streptomyces rhizosphaerihabitans]|nr:transcriptional regulator [Streptomyces rhizosphaerihabitans]
PTVSDSTHQPLPQRQLTHLRGPLGLSHLPSAAADLILLGDLTGRYATGSYSRLSSDRRSLVLRTDRQGTAEHGHRITAAIACHVARAGGTLDQLTGLRLHPEHEGGRHTRQIALCSGQSRALDHIRRVWASASDAVGSTRASGSRHEAYEVLAALRDRIETTPWRGERGRTALRVLRAHLNFAEIAGGPLHHASERQAAEEAGVPRTTLRAVYETVLKPQGWLRRLRVGHGREGSTGYLDHGSAPGHGAPASSRFRTTQYPPTRHLRSGPPLRRPRRPTSTPPSSVT